MDDRNDLERFEAVGKAHAHYDLHESIEMGSVAPEEDDGDPDIHPDYRREQGKAKWATFGQEQGGKNLHTRGNETGIFIIGKFSHTSGINKPPHTGGINKPPHTDRINKPSHTGGINKPPHTDDISHSVHTDSIDEVKKLSSTVAPKKPKRKTASTGSRSRAQSTYFINTAHSEVITTSEGKELSQPMSFSDSDVQRPGKDHIQNDKCVADDINRSPTFMNQSGGINRIHSPNNCSYDNSHEQPLNGTQLGAPTIDHRDPHSGFGTTVAHILGRKPRFDKCKSFDEAEMRRNGEAHSSTLDQAHSSEWPPFRKTTGDSKLKKPFENQRVHNTALPPNNIYKGTFNLSEVGRESKDGYGYDYYKFRDNRLRTNVHGFLRNHNFDSARNSSIESTPEPASPSFLSESEDDIILAEHGPQSEATLSAPSLGFPFLSKATNRILARRELLKRRRSLGSVLPHEAENQSSETESFRHHGRGNLQVLKSETAEPENLSARFVSRPLYSQDLVSADVFLRSVKQVPQITITDRHDYLVAAEPPDELGSYPGTLSVSSLSQNTSHEDSLADKMRRFSAPNMPDLSTQLPSISPAFRRRIFKSISSDGLGGDDVKWRSKDWGTLPENQRSWSDDFYDLIMRTGSNDPEKAEYFKKMVNDRYEALFSKKYPGLKFGDPRSSVDGTYRRIGMTDNPSPRTVKRRSAATRQKRLSRDSSPNLSPYSSIDALASVEDQTATSLEEIQDGTEYLRVPDQSQWSFLYDKACHSDRNSTSDSGSVRVKLTSSTESQRSGLADGTDGADSDENSTSSAHNYLNQDSLGSTSLGLVTKPQQPVRHSSDDAAQNDEMHIYSELQGPVSDTNGNDYSGTNTKIEGQHNGEDANNSFTSEPIYESIMIIKQRKLRKNNWDSCKEPSVRSQNVQAMREDSDDAKNIYHNIEDLRGHQVEAMPRSSQYENGKTNLPRLPPNRPDKTTQLPKPKSYSNHPALKMRTVQRKVIHDSQIQGSKTTRLKQTHSRPLRPRSLTFDSINHQMQTFLHSTEMIKSKRHDVTKMAGRDKSAFSSRAKANQRQIPLKKAHKFPKDIETNKYSVDIAPELVSNKPDFPGSKSKPQHYSLRARANSMPSQGINNIWDDLDLTQFRSTAGNIILEHADKSEDPWLGGHPVLQDTHTSAEETTPKTTAINLSSNSRVYSGETKGGKPKRIHYLDIDKTLLRGLQKSSV